MKSITRAGGTGSRLYPQTKVTNIHFLQFHDKPMIYYHPDTSKLILYNKMKTSDRIFGRMDIDVMDVIEAAATKWNFNVYYPGAGVGGHCLPVDPYYLVTKAEELGYHSKVITAGRAVNDYMPLHVFELLVDVMNECEMAVKGAKVVVLGFSYKENVGDPRESPVEVFVEKLRKKGARVCIVDPYIEDGYLDKYGEVEKDVYKAIEGADAVVLMTGPGSSGRLICGG